MQQNNPKVARSAHSGEAVSRPIPGAPGPRSGPPRPSSRFRRGVSLALLTYALGLIPFYFLTPVHESIQSALQPSPPTPTVAPAAGPARVPPSVATPPANPIVPIATPPPTATAAV